MLFINIKLKFETGMSDFHKLIITILNNSSFIELKTIFTELLNKVVPVSTKYFRASYSKFMMKEPSKAIILRTKLRNKFLKKGHQKLN